MAEGVAEVAASECSRPVHNGIAQAPRRQNPPRRRDQRERLPLLSRRVANDEPELLEFSPTSWLGRRAPPPEPGLPDEKLAAQMVHTLAKEVMALNQQVVEPAENVHAYTPTSLARQPSRARSACAEQTQRSAKGRRPAPGAAGRPQQHRYQRRTRTTQAGAGVRDRAVRSAKTPSKPPAVNR
ncbi:hypothetical protein CP975_34135 [Streptomyces alboniger]|uniref:Uncharacterized protein n=1 Tax=Streptomyces alboniger TaxID=132473 RepID=A0A5J6HUA8_STRAD|nr:hypothetical protein CP975_34135 [Streptomyces alboniger]